MTSRPTGAYKPQAATDIWGFVSVLFSFFLFFYFFGGGVCLPFFLALEVLGIEGLGAR